MERTSSMKRRPSTPPLPERVTLLDARAEKLFERERYAEASRLYQEALGLEKQPNARAYFLGQLGICQYNLGQDRQALRSLRRSAQMFRPGEPEFMPDMYGFVHFHLGSILEYQGRTAQSLAARRVCEQYVETQEKDTKWMLYAGLSRNFESAGDHGEAIRYSQKAIQILSDDDPGLAYLYESMANNHMRLHEYPEAINYLSKVLEIAPDFERKDEIYLNVAHCYDQIMNDRMALETYEKILELKRITGKRENATWIYLKIAHSHFRLEQFEKSLLVTLEGLRRRPKNVQERAEIGGLLAANYCELGRYREAVAEGEKTLKLAKRFPNSNLLYFRLALAYQKLGDRKNFSKCRTLCRKLFPDDTWNGYLEKLG